MTSLGVKPPSLLSYVTVRFPPPSGLATIKPLLTLLPFTHPWTREVMSHEWIPVDPVLRFATAVVLNVPPAAVQFDPESRSVQFAAPGVPLPAPSFQLSSSS